MRQITFQVVSHLIPGPSDESGGRFVVGPDETDYADEAHAQQAAVKYAQIIFMGWVRTMGDRAPKVTVELRETEVVYDSGTEYPFMAGA